jgi:hypothetical protein
MIRLTCDPNQVLVVAETATGTISSSPPLLRSLLLGRIAYINLWYGELENDHERL